MGRLDESAALRLQRSPAVTKKPKYAFVLNAIRRMLDGGEKHDVASSEPAKKPNVLTTRQHQIKGLISHFDRHVTASSISRPTDLQAKHVRGATLLGVRAIRASLPAAVVRSPALLPTTWWSEDEVKKTDVEDALATQPDSDTSTERDEAASSDTRLVSETELPVTLLNGRQIRMVRRVLYSIRTKRRFKEYLAIDGDKVFPFNKVLRDLIPLYGVDKIDLSDDDSSVTVVESTGPADALAKRKILAVGTMTGAFVAPSVNALQPLMAAQTIYLWPDNDPVGARHMDLVAARLTAMGHSDVRIVFWRGGPRKGDAADFDGEPSELKKLYEDARQWSEASRIPQSNVISVRPSHRLIGRISLSDELRPPMPRI